VLIDQATGAEFIPLQNLDPGQAPFSMHDSLLSEYAALGFEYGYSVARPDALVLWEAQFGDFVNGAQIILDQFVAAAQEKWGQRSRLTLLLPHGSEGQGPEHSSARPERFLQLAARHNLRVVIPTTAAQYFHLLRRQAYLAPAVPLVVMTPKSLLRARPAESAAAELSSGSFQRTLPDHEPMGQARRLVLCSGKVAYDLLEHRRAHGIGDTAVVRVEQLYPFPAYEVAALVSSMPGLAEVRWVQEEPRNMGGWTFAAPLVADVLRSLPLGYVGRPANPSPATGSARLHGVEQARLVAEAFA
jgi:2-oxoglutarate dehydrogenase complex dehydrogenase (E1) component-like enzyme